MRRRIMEQYYDFYTGRLPHMSTSGRTLIAYGYFMQLHFLMFKLMPG